MAVLRFLVLLSISSAAVAHEGHEHKKAAPAPEMVELPRPHEKKADFFGPKIKLKNTDVLFGLDQEKRLTVKIIRRF
jgi:hypothetical protein